MAYFVEHCWEFPVSKLGKCILNPATEKTGKVLVLNQANLLVVDSEVILGDKPRVKLSWDMDGRMHYDTLYLTTAKLTFGARVYWCCSMCGRAVFKVFHRRGYFGWSCFRCLGLRHIVQYFNTYTTPGRLQYWMNRLNKLKELEVGLKRCPRIYRNKPTKRFCSYFKCKVRWTVSKAMFEYALANLGGAAGQSPR
jgi:hypothetical protein